MSAVLATLLAVGVIAPAATPPRAEEFRTEAAPRIDPVFDDVASLRHVIDQFFALHADMERVRDEFSGAVHDTFAALGPIGGRPPQICPAELAPLYARASEQGRRFLALGRRLAGRSREIRRADDLGDTVGLTPDYRIKAKKVRELYLALVRDYREMRVAYYDQLGAEMHHAGCKPPAAVGEAGSEAGAGARGPTAPGERFGPDPANANDWVLDPPDDEQHGPAGGVQAAVVGASTGALAAPEAPDATAVGEGPAIWIEIDNSRCADASTLTIDGRSVGEIAGQKKIPVRTRTGPHELCVLPVHGEKTCGAAGTVRRAYLYEGWTLAVRCGH